ncbi:MAG: hypothetical protein CML31_00745 [Rhizobiales bacterium]|nr:hypothetical protein [Hyphomicrobiales bacterium]
MNEEQMDLFTYERRALRSAEVIAFPIDQRLIHIRMTARQLEAKKGEAADRFWRTECRRLWGRLQAEGFSEIEVRAQIADFAEAVHSEMKRAAWATWKAGSPLGAA